jgi:acetyl esterase/lipase
MELPVSEGVRTLRNLEYACVGERPLLLDLYMPESAPGPLPLIVWVHGGAWLGGDKSDCPAVPWTRLGYAVASIGYRFSGEAIFPAQIEDCKAAVRWLRAHSGEYGLDPHRFGAWGASAGGHLVALLGTAAHVREWESVGEHREVSSGVQAVCDWFGPSDLTEMSAFPSVIDHDAPDAAEALLIGGPVQQNKEKAARANPITYVTPDAPPFLIQHGDRDDIVPINQSELLYAALREASVEVTYDVIEGAGHGGPEFGSERVLGAVQEFFDRQLKGST